MIKTFFFAFVMFWAGSTPAQEPATTSTPAKSDPAVETSAEHADHNVSRDNRKAGKSAVAPSERRSAAAKKADTKLPARSTVADESRNGESSKREAPEPENDAAESAPDLDSPTFGTGAEGGEAAVKEANVLGRQETDGEPRRLPPFNILFAGVGALFLVLLTTAAVLEHLDLAKLRKMVFVYGDRITTVNGRIDQQASMLMTPIHEQVKQLRERLEALERKNTSLPHAPLVGRSYEREDPLARRPPIAAPPPPRFPALVSDVLAQSSSAMVRVKADPIDQDVFVPSHDGAFYLVQDGMAGLCVIPAHEPMTTQLYKTYYKSSYDCSVQGTGDLYVVEPATVSARGELWRLSSRGKLEVRAS